MVMVDGNRCPKWSRPSVAVVAGDAKCRSIAAASIVAKVTRDRMMVTYAETHPGYGWEHNRGYPTPDHRRALRDLGPTPLHRRSFGLVREMLAATAQPELHLHEMPTASPLSHTTTA
jgi:ribonuclease HII